MNRDEYIMPPDPNYGKLRIKDNTLPNYNISFTNKGGEVGKLDFNGPEMKFIGNADESAKVLFDWLTEAFKLRLEQERKQERARCIEQVKRTLEALENP